VPNPQRGLITRVPSDQDRRGAILAWTLLPQTAACTQGLFAPMPSPERQALLEQLQSLLSRIDN
jgi:DNA-binding MarR family transcriptional regulator